VTSSRRWCEASFAGPSAIEERSDPVGEALYHFAASPRECVPAPLVRPDVRAWQAEPELVGAGGDPVDLPRTLASHGVADLPSNEIYAEAVTLTTTTLALPQGVTTVHVGDEREKLRA
jgi:hypothetical protein